MHMVVPGPPALGRALAGTVTAGLVANALPSALILPALTRRQPQNLGRSCRWRTPSSDAVAVTFDDGPDVETLRTLDVLEHLGLRATFFALGSQLQSHPGIAKEIRTRGHELATHGYAHRHHLLTRPSAIRQDLDRAVEAHREVLDEAPRFFRPPYGQLALASVLEARRRGLEPVLWSTWGKEWVDTDDAAVLGRIGAGLRPGTILLLHDNDVSCPPGTGDRTRSLLRPIAGLLEARGLRGVALGELLCDRGRP